MLDIQDTHYDQGQLAAFLHRDIRTLARWRSARKGPPFVRIGKTPYYNHQSVDRWLTANETLTERKGR
jgi:hypothetical protein